MQGIITSILGMIRKQADHSRKNIFLYHKVSSFKKSYETIKNPALYVIDSLIIYTDTSLLTDTLLS